MTLDLLLTLFEWVALISGIVCVVLLLRQNIWTFPIGLVFSAVTLVILINQRLYVNSIEMAYYLAMNGYGWWFWARGHANERHQQDELPVSHMPASWWPLVLTVGVVVAVVLGYLFDSYTDASVAYWDSATTVSAFIAMWMSARKYLQSWVLWFLVDIAYVGLYYYKDLPTYVILYVLYIPLAVMGWQAWQRDLKQPA